MFPEISIKTDFDRLARWAKTIAADQVPFAAALALTWTGQEVKAAIERDMATVFDRPTPFTMRGLRLYPATKRKLEATVWFRASTTSDSRNYLSPEVFGGERKLKAFEKSLQRANLLPVGMQAYPGAGAQLDQYGNMARSQIVQLLAYFKAFGVDGARSNTSDKRKAALAIGSARRGARGVVYFAGRPGNGKLPNGIWERSSFGLWGSSIRPIVIFAKPAKYGKRLPFFEDAQKVIADRFEPNFFKAWRQVLATARRVSF